MATYPSGPFLLDKEWGGQRQQDHRPTLGLSDPDPHQEGTAAVAQGTEPTRLPQLPAHMLAEGSQVSRTTSLGQLP